MRGSRWLIGLVTFVALVLPARSVRAADPDSHEGKKRVVLIAGKKSHGPEGNGQHDYGWSVKLLKHMLEHSDVASQLKVESYFDGWPPESVKLDDAATIVVISDGRDGNLFSDALHLESPQRVALVDRLAKKGCGLVTFHFSTFAPQKDADRVLDWTGGYYQWETDGKRQWYSAITTTEAELRVASPDHPVSRGLKPWSMREEFYYNLRFDPKTYPVTPILEVPALKGRAESGNVVAFARQRPGGGRGFGTTCGHYYDNWKQEGLRKLMLNAIAWTAHAEVPEKGVEARYYERNEIESK